MAEKSSSRKKRNLGKGLSELLGDSNEISEKQATGILNINVDDLQPGEFQPRTHFDMEALDSLSASIKENGVLQPILIRKKNKGYEIVAGERRWRASKNAGLSTIPALVIEGDDKNALESGLIENIQREDLTPIEEAKAYKRLIDDFGYTQQDISLKIGKSRSHIANTIRLLSLPDLLQEYVSEGKLSAGHARVLVGHDNAPQIAEDAIRKGLNVRQLEKIMQKYREGESTPANNNSFDPDKESIEAQLSRLLGFKTSLKLNHKGGGVIEIAFETMEDIDSLMQTLMKMKGFAA